MHKSNHGFTLIELMVVVVIVALLAAIALPSYQQYIRKKDMALAQQEMLKLADQLERHKAKNFSYKKFDPKYLYSGITTPLNVVYVPGGISTAKSKYKIEIKDISNSTEVDLLTSSLGKAWSMKASPINSSDALLYTFLITSHGIKCKAKEAENVSFTACSGQGAEDW
ncbi:prepilin-type N-terminal cleavage/methylation domain-containing protein [Acinetobacter thermotolerans]|uniref:prepilin-type N-terminal cleavage/methylation domain-containing protein n=1 Tax=Acinetobacter thermotolerans TaxID=3151487 RepID=UPI00325B5D4B